MVSVTFTWMKLLTDGRHERNIDFYFNRFLVSGGCLIFYVVPKDSTVETEYVNKKRNPIVKPF